MPLLAKSHLPISTKDIISWCYENRSSYDQDKPIYIDCADPARSISARQAFKYIRQLVAGFRAAGLRKDDVVCIHSFNSIYYPILVHGIVAAGGIFVGTNPSYTTYELAHAFKTSQAKFLIAAPEVLAAPRDAALKAGFPKDNILLLAEPADCGDHGYSSWRTLLQHGEQDWVRFDDLGTAKNTPAFLLFSSGTTGLPKAAIQSHYNLVAEHTLVHENPSELEPYHMSRMASLPMFHTAIGPYVHVSTLRSGRESYIMPRFALREYLEYHRHFKITNIIIVPPMVVAIVNAADQEREWVCRCLSSVKAGVVGAAPLDKETQARFQSLLPDASTFTQVLGMTETTCISSYLYSSEKDDTGSVGRFIPNIDVKLVDPDNASLEVGPYDVRGELCVRGPTVIRGYLNNPEANTRDWDADGFFHTGDVVYCDSKTGLYYVVDRKKELIKVRGFQVAPNEIEGVLLSHPGIVDTAVIGVVCGEAGELPRAYIVCSPGTTLTEADVRDWVGQRLARYKQVEGGVHFVASIPKSVSGKILKRILREEAKKEGAKL